ncbi:MAG: FG-GAP-like repeat-containing protein, partial [Euryarchaeota archaeon]|nr:FG-GAP-like repeat-containing protein [Euryarchaeota archaeon]
MNKTYVRKHFLQAGIAVMLCIILMIPSFQAFTTTKKTIDTKNESLLEDTILTRGANSQKYVSDVPFAEDQTTLLTPTGTDYFISDKTNGIYGDDFSSRSAQSPEELNAELTKQGALWRASENKFTKMSDEEIQGSLGLIFDPNDTKKQQDESRTFQEKTESLPDFFDWRSQHSQNYITPIRDQGGCGSCWAFAIVAAVEAAANTFYNDPDLDPDLSEQDLVSCYHGDGCRGATKDQTEYALSTYLQTTGIANETCFSYIADNGDCNDKCPTWEEEKWLITSYVNVNLTQNAITAIKSAIMSYGPVITGMAVYNDFYTYHEGIYHRVSETIKGYHAVAIVGFGVYDGMDYWICKNSWGEDWGEDGYFRIFAGECLIDSWFIFAVDRPLPPIPVQVQCTDQDQDGYYYWGIGPKPTYCPPCPDIEDCNDSDSSIFSGCGCAVEPTGMLTVTSTPTNATVYIIDQQTGELVLRGYTPLLITLNTGLREITLKKLGYSDYTITVEIIEEEETILDIPLLHDPQFQEGWPVKIHEGGTTGGTSPPVIADVDNDGDNEIIVATIRPALLYAFHYNGTPLWVHSFGESINLANPVVADLENDGAQEVIISSDNSSDPDHSMLYVFESNGTYSEQWPQIIDSKFGQCSPSIGDIDSDGDQEIILGSGWASSGSKIQAYHHTGDPVENWPVNLFSPYFPMNTPVIADVDDDGDLEISVFSVQIGNPFGLLQVFHGNGSVVSGFPVPVPFADNGYRGLIAAADFNKDNKNEIIAYEHMYDGSGHPVEEWTIQSHVKSYLGIADVDDNEYPELVYAGWDEEYEDTCLNVVDHHGIPLSGWPQEIPDYYGWGITPIVGDIDGDGDKEILFGDRNNLYAWHHDGTLVVGFPKVVENQRHAGLALSDLDGDGDVELISCTINTLPWEVGDNYIYVWDLPGTYNKNTMDWPMFQHDAQHTGLYIDPDPLPDLIVTDFEIEYNKISSNLSARFGSQTTVILTATIKNNGTIDITTPFQVSFYGIPDDSNEYRQLGSVLIPSLAAGTTKNISINTMV